MENDVLRAGRPQLRMVDSGPGRTDRPELGRLRGKAGSLPKPDDREVREPRPPLRLVHAEPLEAGVQASGETPRRAALVVEDEHPDAPCLAVAARTEDDGGG